jgi:hypothetical protein
VKIYTYNMVININRTSLEVITQLTNVEIARPDVMIRVRTRDLTQKKELVVMNLTGTNIEFP